MNSDIIIQLHKNFEDCAHQIDGEEFWFARELQPLLGYSQWRNFEQVIDKAKMACQTAGHSVSDHFADVSKTILMPKGAEKDIDDLMLTLYACYLIAQNGDPRGGDCFSGKPIAYERMARNFSCCIFARTHRSLLC